MPQHIGPEHLVCGICRQRDKGAIIIRNYMFII